MSSGADKCSRYHFTFSVREENNQDTATALAFGVIPQTFSRHVIEQPQAVPVAGLALLLVACIYPAPVHG